MCDSVCVSLCVCAFRWCGPFSTEKGVCVCVRVTVSVTVNMRVFRCVCVFECVCEREKVSV